MTRLRMKSLSSTAIRVGVVLSLAFFGGAIAGGVVLMLRGEWPRG